MLFHANDLGMLCLQLRPVLIVLELAPLTLRKLKDDNKTREIQNLRGENRTLQDGESAWKRESLTSGVAYLHARSIVHLDIKPENVVCVDRTSFRLKLVDFGLARRWRLPSTHCYKSYPNFRDIKWNEEENEIHTAWNISRSVTFSPLHFILYGGKSISFGTVQLRKYRDITHTVYELLSCFQIG